MKVYLTYKELYNAIAHSVERLRELILDYNGVKTLNGKSGAVKLRKLNFTGYANQSFDFSGNTTVKIPTLDGLDTPSAIKFSGEATGEWNGDVICTVNVPIPYAPVTSVNGGKGAVNVTAENVGGINKDKLPTELPSANAVSFVGGATGKYNGSAEIHVKIPVQPDNVISVNGQSGAVRIGAVDIGAATPAQIPSALPCGNGIEFTGADTGEYTGEAALVIEIPKPLAQNVQSVNNLKGAVVLDSALVKALPSTTKKLKNPYRLTFTGLVNTYYDGSFDLTINIPPESLGVTSVNGYTGAVRITPSDVKATPQTETLKCPESLSWSGNNSGVYDGSASTFVALPSTISTSEQHPSFPTAATKEISVPAVAKKGVVIVTITGSQHKAVTAKIQAVPSDTGAYKLLGESTKGATIDQNNSDYRNIVQSFFFYVPVAGNVEFNFASTAYIFSGLKATVVNWEVS